jgi:hypothetical protein
MMSALRTMARIFFSLNWQDLPEYFEDHMAEWMEVQGGGIGEYIGGGRWHTAFLWLHA